MLDIPYFSAMRSFILSIKPVQLICIMACLLVVGCSSSRVINYNNATEQELYQWAQQDIKRDEFLDAIEILQKMEKLYPFGEYSKAAQLSLIYAHYQFGSIEAADAAADRFIRLHPKHRHVDYAYYMKGLLSFPEAETFLQQFAKVDLSKRDVSDSRTSFSHFSRLVKLFPESQYSPDALKRMEFLRNLLARHEIHVANYYFERSAYLAAANRGRYVVENFQKTPAIPDALAVMAQGYHKMDMHELANNSIETLKVNYPDYPGLNSDGSFNFNYNTRQTSSLFNTLTFGLLAGSKPPGFNTEKRYSKPETL